MKNALAVVRPFTAYPNPNCIQTSNVAIAILLLALWIVRTALKLNGIQVPEHNLKTVYLYQTRKRVGAIQTFPDHKLLIHNADVSPKLYYFSTYT